jgi:hypothetical protein
MGNLLTRQIPVYKIYLGFVGLLFFLLIVSSLFPLSGNRIRTGAKIAKTRIEEESAATALKAYSTTYGNLPIGDAESVERILGGEDLFGKNPQKIMFLIYQRSVEFSNRMVDAWGTPYHIEFFQQTNFIIHSAGKDKIFGDTDDIIFNSASNNFIKP